MIVYWLIPAPPARDFFASLISELAERFNARPFQPHVTIHADDAGENEAMPTIELIATEFRALNLSTADICFSEKFTKTLFVQFHASTELARMSERIKARSGQKSGYRLDPHLSLIYKTMPNEQKAELAASIQLPFKEVIFDAIEAINVPREATTPEDVETWKKVGRGALKSD